MFEYHDRDDIMGTFTWTCARTHKFSRLFRTVVRYLINVVRCMVKKGPINIIPFLVQKWIGRRKLLFSGGSQVCCVKCRILETIFFPKACFTHVTAYAYLPLFMGSWNIQEHLISNLRWAGDSQFCGGFHHFAFLRHGSKLAIFCVAAMNCIF